MSFKFKGKPCGVSMGVGVGGGLGGGCVLGKNDLPFIIRKIMVKIITC
jgi:hypothetical protein